MPSPDGRSLYVITGARSTNVQIAVLRRGRNGALRQSAGRAGCVYWRLSGAKRNCYRAPYLPDVADLVVSPDGRNLYAAVSDAWVAFRRHTGGALRQLSGRRGCGVSDPLKIGGNEGCNVTDLPLGGEHAVASPDGRHVYFGGDWVLSAYRRLP